MSNFSQRVDTKQIIVERSYFEEMQSKAQSYDQISSARDMGIDFYDSINGTVIKDLTVWTQLMGVELNDQVCE